MGEKGKSAKTLRCNRQRPTTLRYGGMQCNEGLTKKKKPHAENRNWMGSSDTTERQLAEPE